MGGLDGKNNMVELTAREHFICHKLLCVIHPQENKLLYALWLMAIGKKRSKNVDPYKITGREYERIKIEFSFRRKQIKVTQQHKNKISKSNSIPVYQYNKKGEFIMMWKSCVEAEMHMNNVDHWTKCNDNIGSCARGETKTAYGFIWDYTELPLDSSRFDIRANRDEVTQIDVNGNIITQFPSKSAAKRYLKISNHMFYALVSKPFEENISHKLRKIIQLDLSGNIISSYNSLSQTKEKGFNPSSISNVLRKTSHTSGGYKWEYLEDDTIIKYRLQWKQ